MTNSTKRLNSPQEPKEEPLQPPALPWITLEGPGRPCVLTQGLMCGAGILTEKDDAGWCGSVLGEYGRKCSAERLNALAYANLAAGMGGFANLWLKCTMMLAWVSLSGRNINEFKYFATWVVVIVTVAFLIVQLMYLNLGLAKHDSITIIPIYQGLFLVNTMMVGGVYFNEFESLDVLGALFFSVGMVIIVAGLMILTSREKIVLPDPLGTHSPIQSPTAPSPTGADFQALELSTPRGAMAVELGELSARQAGDS